MTLVKQLKTDKDKERDEMRKSIQGIQIKFNFLKRKPKSYVFHNWKKSNKPVTFSQRMDQVKTKESAM